MDIQLEKQEIIERLLQTNDESIIASIKSLLTNEKKRFLGGVDRGAANRNLIIIKRI